MSEALVPRVLKILFGRGGAPKWVVEPGANRDNDAMQVVVRKRQEIQWKRQQGNDDTPFTIEFDDPEAGTPFSNWDGLLSKTSGGPQNIVTGIVSESDDLDVVYKYSVKVTGKKTLDPMIIMDK
jgi:hypothetical protein